MLLINNKRVDNLPKMEKIALFQLVGHTHEDPNLVTASGEKYVRKSKTTKIPTTYTRFNKDANQNEEYRYALRETPIMHGAQKISKYSPDRVVFTSTILTVNTDRPDLYEYLRKSPWIEGNGGQKILYREVDPKKDAQSRVKTERDRSRAMLLISDEENGLPEITLRRLASALAGIDGDNSDIDLVRDSLLDYAAKNPEEFLKQSGSKDVMLKSLISGLSRKGFIHYDASKLMWTWGENTKESGNKIVSVPPGKSETDWMIETVLRDDELMKAFKGMGNAKETIASPKVDKAILISQLKELGEKLGDTKIAQGAHLMSEEKLIQRLKNATEKSLASAG